MGLNPSFSGCPALGVKYKGTFEYKNIRLNPSFSGCPALGSKNLTAN